MLTLSSREKYKYVCGSSNPDVFKEIRRIVLYYAHEHPKFYAKKLQHGRVYNGLSVLLTAEEQRNIRREIKWIGVPESCRVEE